MLDDPPNLPPLGVVLASVGEGRHQAHRRDCVLLELVHGSGSCCFMSRRDIASVAVLAAEE
jgi:hypothetical protein